MAQHSRVPKFGNWESAGDVPYTQYFDNARKGRSGGKLINPNDPHENLEAFFDKAPPPHGLLVRARSDPEDSKPKHERRLSREGVDPHRPVDFPLRHDVMACNSPHHLYGDRSDRVNAGEPQRRASKVSGGSDTPGRSRIRPGGQGNIDASEKGSTVPKFGEWDESNPASADGFTHIFDKVREEKQIGSAKVPAIYGESYPNGHKRVSSSESVTCCCLGFGK